MRQWPAVMQKLKELLKKETNELAIEAAETIVANMKGQHVCHFQRAKRAARISFAKAHFLPSNFTSLNNDLFKKEAGAFGHGSRIAKLALGIHS